jgi:hypothetical protein
MSCETGKKPVNRFVRRFASETGRTGSIAADLALCVVLFGIVGMFILIGLSLSLWSLYLFLGQFISPPAAGSVAGLCAFVLAACLVWIAVRTAGGITRGKGSRTNRSLSDPLALVQEKPMETVLTAFSVGMMMGISPDTRKVVTETTLSLLQQRDQEKP